MYKLIKSVGIISLIGCLLLITFMCLEVYAQDYIVSPQGQVTANISDKGVNRIVIDSDRITQVIGNEDEYIIESDDNLGQIFLTPILKSPKDISLKLVTERDKIIDAKLKIKKIEPQTLNLKYNNEVNSTLSNIKTDSSSHSNALSNNFSITQMSGNSETQYIIDNLKLAHSGKLQGIKLPVLGCLKKNPKFKNLKLVEATQYSVNKQIIVKAVVSNSKKDEILLNESDLSNCMEIVKAVSLESRTLRKDMNVTIYMVGQDGK